MTGAGPTVPSAPAVAGASWFDGRPASACVQAGDLVFVGGQSAGPAEGDVSAQARAAFAAIERALAVCGGGLEDIVDLMSFHRDMRELGPVLEVGRECLGPDYPAWTPVGVSGFPDPSARVSIRATAHLGDGPKRCISTPATAWTEGLPLSAACGRGDLLFVSGQTAVGPDGAPLSRGEDARGSRLAYERAAELVAAAGGSMDDVIDICSFHLDPRGMIPSERVHMEVWDGVRPDGAPSWTAIGVPALALPGTTSQYRLIADLGGGARIGRVSASIHWRDTPNAGASRKERRTLIGIAGEVASDAEGNVTTPGDTLAQARYAFERIREVVELHGSSMDRVVEITAFHKDPRAWGLVMEAASEYFDAERGPAWTSVGVTGLWNPGYLHEIYASAVL